MNAISHERDLLAFGRPRWHLVNCHVVGIPIAIGHEDYSRLPRVGKGLGGTIGTCEKKGKNGYGANL